MEEAASRLAIGDQLSIQPHPWLSMEIIIIIIFSITISIITVITIISPTEHSTEIIIIVVSKGQDEEDGVHFNIVFRSILRKEGEAGAYCLPKGNIPRGVYKVCGPLKSNFCRDRKIFKILLLNFLIMINKFSTLIS